MIAKKVIEGKKMKNSALKYGMNLFAFQKRF